MTTKGTILTLTKNSSVRTFTTQGNYALDSETGKSITINAVYKIIGRLHSKGWTWSTETFTAKAFNDFKLG